MCFSQVEDIVLIANSFEESILLNESLNARTFRWEILRLFIIVLLKCEVLENKTELRFSFFGAFTC